MLVRTLYRTSGLKYVPRVAGSIRWKSSTAQDPIVRYQEKLAEKAKSLGFTSIEEMNSRLKEDIDKKKKELNAIDPLKDLEGFEKAQSEKMKQNMETQIRSPIKEDTPVVPYKTLNSFVDVAKVKDLNETELEFIWRARFQKDERSLVSLLKAPQFLQMYALAFKNKTFILPVPKEGNGHEMHFVQWSFVGPHTTHCMLTTVAEYKLHKEYAKPHTTLMFHQELAEDKDIVLMNGLVEEDANLTMDEAYLLILNIQRFYGAMEKTSPAKLELLKSFNSGKEDFDIEKLIQEATSFE